MDEPIRVRRGSDLSAEPTLLDAVAAKELAGDLSTGSAAEYIIMTEAGGDRPVAVVSGLVEARQSATWMSEDGRPRFVRGRLGDRRGTVASAVHPEVLAHADAWVPFEVEVDMPWPPEQEEVT